MADLILGMNQGSQPFLNDIVAIVDLSCGAVYEMSLNPVDREYTDDLKKAIIELYACLTFALVAQKYNKRLFQHFTTIATFIVKTCDMEVNPTIVSIYCNVGLFKELFVFALRFSFIFLN